MREAAGPTTLIQRETLTLIGRLNGLEGVASRVEKVLESIRLEDEGDKLVEHYRYVSLRLVDLGLRAVSRAEKKETSRYAPESRHSIALSRIVVR